MGKRRAKIPPDRPEPITEGQLEHAAHELVRRGLRAPIILERSEYGARLRAERRHQ